MKRVQVIVAVLVLALAGGILAVGCGLKEAQEAGKRAAGDREDREAAREPTAKPAPTASGESAAGAVRDLRVCGKEDYDPEDEQCTVDRGEEEVQSNEFYCTGRVNAESGDTVTAKWEYQGEEVFTLEVPVSGGGADLPLHTYLTLGPQYNPAGAYRCVLEAGGEEVSATLESGGPEGRVVNAAVCRAEDLVAVGEATEVCAEDASGEVFDEPEELACSATYTDVLGEDLRFEMFYDGTAISAIEYTAHMEAESPSAVISGNLPVTGEDITLEPGPLPPGDYSCRFKVGGEDGELLKELPFEVRGSGT